jgi:DNA-binding transcriptional LysR family regulator
MESRYLKTLLKVAQTGSFSKAAELLHITQSAVSQRIKFLEDRFGHQLLDRSGQTLLPTEAGRLIMERALAILEKEREMEEELKRLGQHKRLSLCCTPTFGMAYLPMVLNDFIVQNADLSDLKFVFHQPEQAVRGVQDSDFDLAIIEHCGELDATNLQVYSLPCDELVFVSAPQLGLPSGAVALERLFPFRLYARRDGCSSKLLLKNNLAACGQEIGDFRGVLISDDLRFTLQAVIAGSGISFVSRILAAAHLANGAILAHQVTGFHQIRSRSIVCHHSKMDDPLLQKFISCVQAVFSNELPMAAAS